MKLVGRGDRRLGEDPRALEPAPARVRGDEPGQVAGCREVAPRGVEVGVGLGERDPTEPLAGHDCVRHRDPVGIERGEPRARLVHPERIEHLRPDRVLPSLGIPRVEREAEDVVRQIVVGERGAVLGGTVVGEELDQKLGRELARVRGADDDGAAVLEPVGHREEALDRHLAGVHRRAELEARDVAVDRGVEVDLPAGGAEDHGRAGQRLRARGDVELGRLVHLAAGRRVRHPQARRPEHPVVLRHRDPDPRGETEIDRALREPRDVVTPLPADRGLARGRWRQQKWWKKEKEQAQERSHRVSPRAESRIERMCR